MPHLTPDDVDRHWAAWDRATAARAALRGELPWRLNDIGWRTLRIGNTIEEVERYERICAERHSSRPTPRQITAWPAKRRDRLRAAGEDIPPRRPGRRRVL
jgi:hypothetical protein